MGGKSSKPKAAGQKKSGDPAAKKYDLNRKSTRRSVRKAGRKDSDSSLDDEDLNLVSVPLDASVSDKRISKARELIKSGRPISISLEATTEEPSQSTPKEGWDDDSRQKWKDQLGLMRHFYDWDEIPMDFFIDTYVGGGGEALRKRRLSLNLVTEAPPNKPAGGPGSPTPLRKQGSDETLPHNQGCARSQPPLLLVTPPSAPATAAAGPNHRQRAVSVDSRAAAQIASSKPLPVVIAEAIPEGNEAEPSPRAGPANQAKPAANAPARAPPALPERPQQQQRQQQPQQPARRARAASVAIGEAFPLPVAAAIQQKATTTSTAAPAAAGKNKQVAQTMEFESRPRSHSNTSLDHVYGRGQRQATNFEMENPLMRPNAQQQQQHQQQSVRRSVAEKRPEQFKNMTAVIDPTQFATERRATRVSIHRRDVPHQPSVDKPLFDDGRVSTTSTMVESNSSQSNSAGLSASRSRDMSDWL